MPLGPGQGFRQRLGGDEHHLVLLGPVGDREPDVREKGARDEGDLLRLDQLLGVLHGFRRLALVVAEEHLELAPEDTALGVDLLDGHLDAGLVRPREGRADAAVGVDLADLDGRLGRRRARAERQGQAGGHEERESS